MLRDRRLLLLSLSGVRIVDPALQELGVTLPGLVERGKTIASLPSLSLLILAAHTPDNWEVSYRDVDEIAASLVEEVVSTGYDLVAITALTARILEAYALADAFRARNISVILGGLHVSALPAEAARHADCVVVGEAEGIWREVLQNYEAGCLRPTYRGPAHFFSTTDAPPRYDLLEPQRYDRVTLQTCRGCALGCHFCGASRLISDFKCKPPDLLRREIEAILSHWERPFVELADDNTFLNRRHGRAVARLLGEYGLKWFTETDISVADDGRLLDSLAESGCRQVLIGLESAVERSLESVGDSGWKQRQWGDYRRKIRRIQATGVSVNGCFVLGLDGDDRRIFQRTLDFVEELELTDVQITIQTPFPGTELYAALAEQGRLLQSEFWPRCTLFDLTFEPRGMSVGQLRRGFAWLMEQLYTTEAHTRRRRRFKAMR